MNQTSRVLLVTPALSVAQRRAAFDDGSPLGPVGVSQARAAAGSLPADVRAMVSPSVRCAETAGELGLKDAGTRAELAGLDAGNWRGRTLEEVGKAEPEALRRWLTEPEAEAPGGESVAQVCARVARWLEDLEPGAGRLIAVVEPDVVRAAVVHAVGAPPAAFWRLDVAPLTVTELSGRLGRWNAGIGRPLSAS
ncbi:histidine phosphatase family protein [Streptomyces kunmingensis]|uniref:Histidine phosphatase family protein n=1 Tax=Streptomyces kunmingensis TaxID=68225 RepID=A0ABU6CDZ9_9ACTN|nr:histidine phosphatase family protein [Streptomyces kunmingensis]MEB3962932.1 histidine phosphatase family protein [Streptomyces kunmingensis]